MKALLILNCDGRQENGFVFCNRVENQILDFEKIRASENFASLITYLDGVPKLFDGYCFNYNVISNTLYKIHELGYFTDKFYNHLIYFCNTHKICGLILSVKLKEQGEKNC